MTRIALMAAIGLLAFGAATQAAEFRFNADPFAGSDALSTPGRQVVGGEDFIVFSVGDDVFQFDGGAFGVTDIQFINALAPDIPASGVNTVVLQTAPVPFNAGLAANAIADQITTPGPGFFIYFNSGLDLPRLVYSTDLSDNTADLKVLARMTNLSGNRDALATFTESNFQVVPEPSTWLMMGSGLLLAGAYRFRRRL
jgi:hypothetical protein